mgnify:FL=1
MAHTIPAYKSAEYVKEKTTVDILWKQLGALQDVAEEFGIENIFQDNGAEILQQLIYLNMKAVPGREGNDGVDINGCEWEMKSLDISKGNGGITTNHHLNHDIIEKYKTVPWSISIYDRIHLKKIYVVGNEQLQPIFQIWEQQLQTLDSLNNPKIPLATIEAQGTLIFEEGMDFPIDPMTVIDTKPYVPLQKAYFDKIRKRHEATEATKAVKKAESGLERAKEKRASNEKDALKKREAAEEAVPAAKKAADKAYTTACQKADRAKQKETDKVAELNQARIFEEAAIVAATTADEAFSTALTTFQHLCNAAPVTI